MEWTVNFLTDLGTTGLDVFWLPVVIWTAVAIVAAGALKLFGNKIPAMYHYHSRVALLWALPAGVIGSALLHFLPSGSTGAAATAKFIVIQNPISVTASAPAASAINWSDPMLWAGFLTLLVLFTAAFALIKLVIDYSSLNSFSYHLSPSDNDSWKELLPANRHLLLANRHKTSIHFSNEVAVPCTFGWLRKHIVLPRHLQKDPEKMNMALRHELTHIANQDFLLNGTVQTIKALFCFHPLVHKLETDIEEYREMHCDQQVLQDADISQKNYASLLFELSPQPVFKPTAAVNMAVQPSTLKKRIQTMKNATQQLPSLKWSITLMLTFALMISGLMACSDIEDNGITSSEVEETQANIDNMSADKKPLFLINGEPFDNSGVQKTGDRSIRFDNSSIMSRLKVKYIENIEVLKGEKATAQYGDKGKNGVVNIKLIDKEKALNDLYTDEELKTRNEKLQNKSNSSTKKNDTYVTVENAPKLKGGLASLHKQVEYPESCRQAGIEGRVTLQFVVNKQGEPEDIEVIRGIGGGCDEAAIEAVKNHADFEPGMQGGKSVKVQYSLPVQFRLSK